MDFKQVNIGWETVNFEQAFDHQLLYSENFVRVYGVAATHMCLIKQLLPISGQCCHFMLPKNGNGNI